MTITPAQTVTTIALAVAADIEEFGHFQPENFFEDDEMDLMNAVSNPTGACCIIANPTMRATEWEDFALFLTTLCERLGLNGVATWSDRTPTPEVLDTLRSL